MSETDHTIAVLELQEEEFRGNILQILDLVEPLPGDLVGPGCPGLFLAVRQDQLVETLRAADVNLPGVSELDANMTPQKPERGNMRRPPSHC